MQKALPKHHTAHIEIYGKYFMFPTFCQNVTHIIYVLGQSHPTEVILPAISYHQTVKE